MAMMVSIITELTAKKYYGEQDPIGKTLRLGEEAEFEIRGVIKDVPDNSHIKFSALVSAETLHQWSEGASRDAWGWYDFNTYIVLKEGADPLAFQEKKQLIMQFLSESLMMNILAAGISILLVELLLP
jgi:putative ABC transport system permease protein